MATAYNYSLTSFGSPSFGPYFGQYLYFNPKDGDPKNVNVFWVTIFLVTVFWVKISLYPKDSDPKDVHVFWVTILWPFFTQNPKDGDLKDVHVLWVTVFWVKVLLSRFNRPLYNEMKFMSG